MTASRCGVPEIDDGIPAEAERSPQIARQDVLDRVAPIAGPVDFLALVGVGSTGMVEGPSVPPPGVGIVADDVVFDLDVHSVACGVEDIEEQQDDL